MVKWKLDKNWFNLVVHVLGLNEVIIATKSGLGYVFLKTLDQRWILFREIRVGVNRFESDPKVSATSNVSKLIS